MGILVDRSETAEYVIVRYSRFLAGIGGIIAIMMVLLLVVQNLVLSVLVYALMIIAIRREMRPIREELVAANDAGLLIRSGRRLSIRDPLTYHIKNSHRPKANARELASVAREVHDMWTFAQ